MFSLAYIIFINICLKTLSFIIVYFCVFQLKELIFFMESSQKGLPNLFFALFFRNYYFFLINFSRGNMNPQILVRTLKKTMKNNN